MNSLPGLPLLFLLAGCAFQDTPASLVRHPHYQALGGPPSWQLAIGDEVIALRLGHDNFPDREVAFVVHRYSRVLPRTTGELRRWEAGDGTAVITIEARPGPCRFAEGARFADKVIVRLSGRELHGCGGRLLGPDRG